MTSSGGRGRAALLRSLLQQASDDQCSENGNVPRPPSSVPSGPPPGLTRVGRGQMIRDHIGTPSQASPGLPSVQTPPVTVNATADIDAAMSVKTSRGARHDFLGTSAGNGTNDYHRDGSHQLHQKMERLSVSSGPSAAPLIRKKLSVNSGSVPVDVASNYVRIHFKPDYGVFEYDVRYQPEVDDVRARYEILDQLGPEIGETKLYDGMNALLVPKAIPAESPAFSLATKHPTTGEDVQVEFQFVAEKPVAHNLRWYNLLFKLIQKDLDMTRIGRNFFMHSERRSVPEYHLEVWPGFVTAVNQFEDGLMLCLDVSHRVLRTETVHEILASIEMSHTFKVQAENVLIKQVIMTRYNNCTHIIDDIAWSETPRNLFVTKSGAVTTYIDYYRKQYDIEIQDEDQPLIVCRQKRTRGGVEIEKKADLVRLVPELCYMTGLSEAMRCNHNVMKSISRYNKPSAEERRMALNKYIADVNASEKAKWRLEEWGLVLDTSLLHPTARILDQPRVRMGHDMSSKVDVFDVHGKFRDWAAKIGEYGVIRAVPLVKWIVIAPIRMRMNIQKFVEAYVKRMSAYLRTSIAPPFIKFISQDSSRDYVAALHECDVPDVQLFVVGFMSQREDKYQVVKKLLCQQMPRPSQCILNRTLSKDNIIPIVNKIALQINCKLGGELWAVENLLPGIMFVGMDVYHDKSKRYDSVVGFVSSSNESSTQYYAQVSKQRPNQDTTDLCRGFMARALQHWAGKNLGKLPNHVIVFRDGLTDGQLPTIGAEEAEAMSNAVFELAHSRPGSLITFTYIVIQKRITTRLFLLQKNRPATNPVPGTAVDSGITRRHRFRDFFLVSQTAKEGTVSPTHFVIVMDTSTFRIDELQTIAYRMTYMYFNWTGSIRIPAPTQYAHKVSQLIGQYVRDLPAASLADRLYFL